MQKFKPYESIEETTSVVSESAAAYIASNRTHSCIPISVSKTESEWDKGLTVEQFRTMCHHRLKEMYANV